jgi:hypothetical protein
MDGLIGQAKSQLWKIENELAAAKCDDGSRPNIKIAFTNMATMGCQVVKGTYAKESTPTEKTERILPVAVT